MLESNKANWLALIGVSILSFTAFLDFTIVNTALPAVQMDLHVSVLKLQWIVNIYAIVLSMLMIMAGKFSDIFGKRKIFYIGALIFIIAGLGAGFAPNINILIFFRAVQGIAGAIIFIGGISLVPSLFPNGNQAQAIGVYSAITGLGLGIGPFLAGILVSTLN
jgi:MFS family permease